MTIGLPGDLPPAAMTERMIRVDHAGEYGATRIYAGQLAVLGRGGKGDLIRHMQAQEQAHLRTFNDMIADRRVRPTAMLPFWHLAGYALGAVTAALGEKAAMACTVAVEEAIDDHYTAQLETLGQLADAGSEEPALRRTVEKFRAEELEHRAIGLEQGAEQAPGYRLLSRVIKAGCRAAIAISERA
ncbi:MAG: 3-demethoxyubiquinol 3-hydroxylase [Acetobacteraceae bacterium]|nr:3-demethoxyubiquinol 3-hydroxylase [Acetobacteraceae bacterium]